MPGRFGRTMPARGWPNLVEIAGAALRHYDEICDPAYHYAPYVGASLGWPTPCFNHHRWDWIEVLPYPLIGRIAARRITGYLGGAEIERRQRQLLLSAFHNLDGFAYPHYVRGWSERTRLCLWEQGRVMFALLAWFEETQDERLLAYVRGIVEGLMRISHREGGHRVIDAPHDTDGAFSVLSPVSMVECLTKYAALTGDPDALELCDGIIHSLLLPETGFTDSSHRLSGSLRGCAAAISGLTRYAVHVQDDRLLERAEGLCRTALSLIAEGGATPEEEPCCTLMEMTTALLALTAAGRGDHWDTVDRWFRNTVVECQFRDPAALNRGYAPGEPKPWDDTRDIVNRSLGGFFWASPYEYLCWRIRLMTCCSGHAIWTLGKIADHAVMDEGPAGGISVNLHYTLETPLAAVSCHEPFAGRLEVVPARTGPVRIRVPSFATGVTVSLDGAEVPHPIRDGYVALDRVPAGARSRWTTRCPSATAIRWSASRRPPRAAPARTSAPRPTPSSATASRPDGAATPSWPSTTRTAARAARSKASPDRPRNSPGTACSPHERLASPPGPAATIPSPASSPTTAVPGSASALRRRQQPQRVVEDLVWTTGAVTVTVLGKDSARSTASVRVVRLSLPHDRLLDGLAPRDERVDLMGRELPVDDTLQLPAGRCEEPGHLRLLPEAVAHLVRGAGLPLNPRTVAQGRVERLLFYRGWWVAVANNHPGAVDRDTHGETLGTPVNRHRLTPRQVEDSGEDFLPELIARFQELVLGYAPWRVTVLAQIVVGRPQQRLRLSDVFPVSDGDLSIPAIVRASEAVLERDVAQVLPVDVEADAGPGAQMHKGNDRRLVAGCGHAFD